MFNAIRNFFIFIILVKVLVAALEAVQEVYHRQTLAQVLLELSPNLEPE